MNLLLDTHAFLWWVADDPRLSERARRQIASPKNDVLVSCVSVWEIVTKAGLGRLDLPRAPDRFVPEQIRENGFGVLPLQLAHALALASLPDHHRDPFDRLLAAQATVERIPIVTSDRALAGYPIKIVW